MKVRTVLAAAVAAIVLALPAAASAHVTVNPGIVTAGSFSVLGVRVPNERDGASTVKVELRLPHGFTFLSYEPQVGWKVKLLKRHLGTPIEVFGEQVDSEFSKVILTGSRKGLGKIAPGQFREFRLSTLVPGKAGDVLAFKALQTYSDGKVVKWTGAPDADAPAPQITLTAPAATSSLTARAAHAQVIRRTPRPGSTVGDVRTVSVKLGDDILGGSITVARGGRALTPAVSGLKPGSSAVLRATFSKKLRRGTYRVSWQALVGDGHRQEGAWSFAVS
ncbi:MAG TPA: DUF1775 domain-containing protein [Conexibacter sp.]|nr:DUF1775 domain-containing protein [Conexibacter sp.]